MSHSSCRCHLAEGRKKTGDGDGEVGSRIDRPFLSIRCFFSVCCWCHDAAGSVQVEMLLLKELHHDNIVSLLGAGFLPDGRRFVALVRDK